MTITPISLVMWGSIDLPVAEPTANEKKSILNQRIQVTFRGCVQGVGFRYTTLRIATAYAVTGFVKNLTDGGVLLVAEGPKDELERMINNVQTTMKRYIEGNESIWAPATGEFESFAIRY